MFLKNKTGFILLEKREKRGVVRLSLKREREREDDELNLNSMSYSSRRVADNFWIVVT